MSRDPKTLSPEMQTLYLRFVSKMNVDDIEFIPTCFRRTEEEQKELYAIGRTKPGTKVTWTLNSRHLTGNAFDFVIVKNGKLCWDTNDQLWKKAVEIGKSLGLKQVVGKDGRIKEFAHLEI